MKHGLALAMFCLGILSLPAAMRMEKVEYKAGDTICEGMVVYDDAFKSRRSGIIIAHQWKGLTAYERMRAELLAVRGHVVMCADVYGKGVRPDNPKDAAATAGHYKDDRNLLRARINAALAYFSRHRLVRADQIAAIGYCFGGTTVLELARSGAAIKGVVSFHGGLSTPTPEDAKNIKAKVLVCHGADDPFVPAEEVQAFQKEMRDAKVDWQFVAYGNAVHSFTDTLAGNDNAKGAAYNKDADVRSWRELKLFLDEVLR